MQNILIGSLKLSTNNLGDHIQIIAMNNLLKLNNLTPTIFLDRDHEVSKCKTLDKIDSKLFVVFNGWFKINGDQWPPNDKIIPLFIGFHMRLTTCPELLSDEAITYYKKYEPIGCRDIFTKNKLINKGIDAYISHCLTLTLPTRIKNPSTQNKIIVASRDRKLLNLLPKYISKDAIYINHITNDFDHDINMKKAIKLCNFYRNNAKLIITTFLHGSLFAIATGIPVVVFYPYHPSHNYKRKSKSDRERFSSLIDLVPIYTFSQINEVNFNPDPIDITKLKNDIIDNFNSHLNKIF